MWVAGKFARIGHAVICSAYNLCVSPTDSSDYQLSADTALGEFCRVAAPFVVIAVLSRVSNGRTRNESAPPWSTRSEFMRNPSRRFTAARSDVTHRSVHLRGDVKAAVEPPSTCNGSCVERAPDIV